ncbi:GNAT family N-acetyltransferase [Bacillus sp. z60-18]|uniref:GNAT family N-acetyltransferase n=1 Tax=Bacillus TaxID=1386 RepID=UPI00098B21A0|nr:GNAT family protein [Bacillus sonorensis]
MEIRKINISDAEQFLKLCQTLDEESEFMMYEPGERLTTIERQREQIRSMLAGSSQILVASAGGSLIGHITAVRGQANRTRHRAHIVIGIRKAYRGQGIGTHLFLALEKWACEEKLHRLELTVMSHNQTAVKLYQKIGFSIEGTRKHAMMVNGTYVDEYFMAKLI